MILTVVTVYDRAADAYGRPVFVNAIGQAVRSFQDEINKPDANNQMYNHSDDFDLYLLGTWDDLTGQFTQEPEPKQIAIGKQLRIYGEKP